MFGYDIPREAVLAIKAARDQARKLDPARQLLCHKGRIYLTLPEETFWTEEGGLNIVKAPEEPAPPP